MHPSIASTLALIVLLAGCSGAVQLDPTSSTETAANETLTPTPTSTPTSTKTDTPKPAEQWTPPRTPNAPIEDKIAEDRISRVRFTGTEPGGNGSGYSTFNLAVYANTTMQSVDPPDHGDVEGEPYILVWIEGEIVARTGILDQQDEMVIIVRITPSALEQFEPGTLEVEVALMDEDSEYDDQYGAWNESVQYVPT